jgi:hypothetical protein
LDTENDFTWIEAFEGWNLIFLCIL